ncbi:NAD(P)-binding protein [Pseudovirgaria hyperparasitica]|uniref:NAD(P)-binding protein n=1 Tax=Pseudovirgaria hyperparasitica TaxID=470096 RepID=A0A6A6W3Q1_9PEZI|nr:NAD(P)-binding protein [Pseudovirgaria hyperparasitica]KAF2756596.1 NAD(P)-binding protein [Pseudovirgaria hyperparasitica]
MPSIHNVALAGASGPIGTATLSALTSANFTVTVLTRLTSNTRLPSSVDVVAVDYTSLTSLTSALRDMDALVCTVGYAGMASQRLLIDAAIAAGVKRIVPSEYGSDPADAKARTLPVFQDKVAVEKYVKEKTSGTMTTYTLLCNNQFFDWDLENNFGINIKERKMEIFDGGEHVYTATPLSFVASGIVGVLMNSLETKNSVVRLHGTSMTQNKLLSLVQKFTGTDGWDLKHVRSDEREKEGYEKLQENPGEFYGWAVPMLQAATFGEGFGNDFSMKHDNKLVGLEDLGEDTVAAIVRERV